MEFNHRTVLLEESLDGLNIKPDGIYVDCTLGGGGHSKGILQRLSLEGKLIAFDQDIDALSVASKRLEDFPQNKIYIHSNFGNIKEALSHQGIDKVDGVLMDIGVSSYQLDNEERGFSYQHDAVLDMRMNREQDFSAKDAVNQLSVDELSRIIYVYGEERWANRIAQFIVEARKYHEISTTYQLVEIIKNAIPAGARRSGPHPAKRTFQALRIFINKELEMLEKALKGSLDILNSNGRLCIITFHSLEDRIVKDFYKIQANPCECPRQIPVCICGKQARIKIITPKPIVPSQEELEANSRARSAKLRIAEKI